MQDRTMGLHTFSGGTEKLAFVSSDQNVNPAERESRQNVFQFTIDNNTITEPLNSSILIGSTDLTKKILLLFLVL